MFKPDKRKLKASIVMAGKSMNDVANHLGINPATLYRKMTGRNEFTLQEMTMFCRYVGITEPAGIFFDPDLRKCNNMEGR